MHGVAITLTIAGLPSTFDLKRRNEFEFMGDTTGPATETTGTGSAAEEEATLERLMRDFQGVLKEAEGFLATSAGESGERAREARERLAASLEGARAGLNEITDTAREGLQAADQTIRRNPYRSLGIAFGVGLLIGVLVRRR